MRSKTRSALFDLDLNWRAKEAARQRLETIQFKYRRIYNLTVNDPRFLDATVEEMLTDIWAHRFEQDPKLLSDVEDEDFDPDEVADIIGANNPDDWEDLSKK